MPGFFIKPVPWLAEALSGLIAGAAALMVSMSIAVAASPREVYLIQNSGWMEPFYLDPQSSFRPLLQAFIEASTLPGAKVTIASFNQAGQLGTLPSPLPLFSGELSGSTLTDTLGKLGLPRRSDGKYTDADYNGALTDTIGKLLSRDAGVIWMVTNNKNSRSNDQRVVENTNRFSSMLTGSDYISSVIAYPLRLPAQGPTFSERGLVIYGIAYGAEAADWLKEASQNTAMQRLMVTKPVRLKPLAQDPVTLTLVGNGDNKVRLSSAGGAISVDNLPGDTSTQIDIPARLTSNYYPQVIEQAHLQAEWLPLEGGLPIAVTVTPETISGMGPDEALDGVHIVLAVPPVARMPGLDGLLHGTAQLHGKLRLQLTDVHLVLQQAFTEKMRDLFGTNADAVSGQVVGARQSTLPTALPAVFLGHQAVVAAATDVPIVFNIVYSPWPLILLIVAIAVTVLVVGGGLMAGLRERPYKIPVGPDTIDVSLRPFRSTTLRSQSGTRVVVTGRLLGQAKVVTLT